MLLDLDNLDPKLSKLISIGGENGSIGADKDTSSSSIQAQLQQIKSLTQNSSNASKLEIELTNKLRAMVGAQQASEISNKNQHLSLEEELAAADSALDKKKKKKNDRRKNKKLKKGGDEGEIEHVMAFELGDQEELTEA